MKKKIAGTKCKDESVKRKVFALENILMEIKAKVLSQCGKVEPKTISGFFEYVTAEIISVKILVEKLALDFTPNDSCKRTCTKNLPQLRYSDCSCICPTECNATAGFVFAAQTCECFYLQGYEIIIEIYKEFSTTYYKVIKSLYDTEKFYEILGKVLKYYFGISNFVEDLKNQWHTISNETKTSKIQSIISGEKGLKEIVNTYISGGCASPCSNRIRLSYNCSCYTSNAVQNFYKGFIDFIKIENKVLNYKFGNKTDKNYFYNFIEKLREQASVLYNKIGNTLPDLEVQQKLVDEFTRNYTKLMTEWAVFNPNTIQTTLPPCSIACTDDNVKNCKSCQCFTVTGWKNLSTVFYKNIGNVLVEIKSLDVNETVKTILTENANTVQKGIESVTNYTKESCNNLNEMKLQNSTAELIERYSTLVSDLEALKTSTSATVCNISHCPNDNWVFDKTACKCSCSVTSCDAENQAVDYFNCLCAPKNSCDKTQDQCGENILDYTNCQCKQSP